eukprot:jgi/Phyca11/5171/fgenesh1_pm.PHYCAscaffold_4_\
MEQRDQDISKLSTNGSQIEVCLNIAVKDKTDGSTELPTLANTLAKTTKTILSNVCGVFKPGTITLLLGQPGSGKSSLMKLLSGRFPTGPNVSIAGEVTYNGISATELKKQLPQMVSYAPQRDEHYPLLTTKESLEFAHCCRGGNSPEFRAGDLVVGDAMHRGVSGGERKRVTTAEMEFGHASVKLMDETSTGLDSSATFDIMAMERANAKKHMKTVVVSLLQPSPEVFALFDDVVILNEGHVMYHGPRKEVRGFFERLGLKCPPHRDFADFLMDLGTTNQSQYEASVGTVPRTACEFAQAFERSDVFARTLEKIANPPTSARPIEPLPEFGQPFWTSTALLMRREITMMKRDMSGLVGRLVMNTIMALLYGVVFYQFDPANPQLVMGIIFEAALCLSLAQAAQIPGAMSARGVFYKQRGANFYRTASYTVVFSLIVYWMCGFASSAGGFVVFAAVLSLANIAFSAFFFFLACASPNVNVANPLSSFTVVFFVLLAGFPITKDQIPDYLVWLYWINPVGWGVRALAVNQYTASDFDKCVYDAVDFCAMYGMKMGEYALTSYAFFVLCSFLALEYHRYESPENVVLHKLEDSDSDYTLTQTPRTAPNSSDVELEVASDVQDLVIPVTIAFNNLWYSVPDPTDPKKTIDLLQGISGYALPGTITALMGSSGAGKTTLMDVLAGRKTNGNI